MPLPIGTWRINVNGLLGDLVIETIDPKLAVVDGSLIGTSGLGTSFFRGTWNETSQCLTFVLVRPNAEGHPTFVPQFFRGLLFSTPMEPPAGHDILWTLVGSLWDTVQRGDLGIRGTARRNEFGWFAQLTQVV